MNQFWWDFKKSKILKAYQVRITQIQAEPNYQEKTCDEMNLTIQT